jgi:hypothetical protein
MSATQDEVIAFLSNGASYGLPGVKVEPIETHCSIVFLVGDRAYKLKRLIAFSSLDYSTVERRATACRAELELNRRTAPELYLGVHAIRRRAAGELGFDGEGRVIDWVVIMRRFDRADLFDHLADAGRLTPELISALADEIAQFHEAAQRTAGFGGADGLRTAIERNRCDLKTVEGILSHEAAVSLNNASLDALKRAGPLLDRRRDEGKVRRCHGDLRLANICLLDRRPTLFDAIEFSDQVSCTDVLFDLAFLLIDLQHHGLDVLANILFNRYLDVTGDTEGLAVLALMLSVRAATRAYILASAVQRQVRREEAQRHAAAARAHLALALSLLADAPAGVIAVGGVGGSGKAAVVHDLAATFRPVPGARVLRSDVARRRLLSIPQNARLPAGAYGEAPTERAYADLALAAQQVVAVGFAVIVDAGFVRAEQRQAMAAAASAASVPFVGLWLGASQDLHRASATGTGDWHAIQQERLGLAATLAAARRLVATIPTAGRQPFTHA